MSLKYFKYKKTKNFENLFLALAAFVILEAKFRVLVVKCVDICDFLRAGTKFAAKLARG